jgi:hypothetical protein
MNAALSKLVQERGQVVANTGVRKQETIKVSKHVFLYDIISGEISSFSVGPVATNNLTRQVRRGYHKGKAAV